MAEVEVIKAVDGPILRKMDLVCKRAYGMFGLYNMA